MQTSYSIDIGAVAFPGQKADIGKDDVVSALGTEAVPYGVAVAQATGSDYPKQLGRLPNSETDLILGIAVADQNRAQDPSVSEPVYPAQSALGLMRQGRIYARVEGAPVAGAAVFVRHAAPGSEQLGALTTVDDANTVALPGARFLSGPQNLDVGGSTVQVAVVELEII